MFAIISMSIMLASSNMLACKCLSIDHQFVYEHLMTNKDVDRSYFTLVMILAVNFGGYKTYKCMDKIHVSPAISA